MDNLNYCTHLFDDSTDGYVQIIKIDDKKVIKIYNTQHKALKEIVEEVTGQDDIYISPNTYYIPNRSTNNIRQYRSLFIDIDVEKFGKYGKVETVYMMYELVNRNIIPEPSMIVDSGRGIHPYFRIKNAPYGAIDTWQNLEDYLYTQLKHLGADIKATDSARVLRLPNTINSRNNAECKILILNADIEYSMYDLREQYLNYKPKNYQLQMEQAKLTKKQCTVSRFFNSYTLHLARAHDIKKLCELRDYDVKGHRNFILHCYAYWEGIYTRNTEELANKVIELNNAFKEPMKLNEVQAILRCIPKAIAKFIEYEQGVMSGEIKRVSKGMKDKGGYWYKNETLIESLEVTTEEMIKGDFKTIINTEVKYARKNDSRRNSRRNEDGLTKKEQQKQDKIKEIEYLKQKGLNNTEIAKQLDISVRYVRKILNGKN